MHLSPAQNADGRSIDMELVAGELNKRLRGAGHAKALADGQIEVDVVGNVHARLEPIKTEVAGSGELEFGVIVADPTRLSDRPIVDQALTFAATEFDVVVDGKTSPNGFRIQ